MSVGDLCARLELGRNFFKEGRGNTSNFTVLTHDEFQELEPVTFGEKKLEELLHNTHHQEKRMEIIEERKEKIFSKIQDI